TPAAPSLSDTRTNDTHNAAKRRLGATQCDLARADILDNAPDRRRLVHGSLVAFRASLEPIISELLERAARPTLDHTNVFVGRLHLQSRLLFEKGRPERSIVEHWKDQLRRVLGIVVDGVGAVLGRAIDVAEQKVRYRRVGTGNLEPNAAAFGEAPGVRQQRDFELVNLFRLERRPLGMGVDGNVVGA